MDNASLIEQFIRIDSIDDGVNVHVGTVVWESPTQPTTIWTHVFTAPPRIHQAALDRMIQLVLETPDYFAVCTLCGERVPAGWISDDGICMSCTGR